MRVNRVLNTTKEVERHYGITGSSSKNPSQLTTLNGGRVLAQPVAVVGPDWALLWAFAPQLQRRPATSATFWKLPPQPVPLKGRVLFAAVDGFSYYHWLFGTLPKLLLAKNSGDFDHYIVNPRHKGRDQFQVDSLSFLDIPVEKARWIDRGTHYICDQLILPSEPCADNQTRLLPWAKQLLRNALLPLAAKASAPAGPEKIYITRAQARRRRIINEAEVTAVLEKFDYTPVVLESLPLLTQIKWLSEAKSVVGLHGAGLANLVFCQPKTRVVEIASDLWPNPCFKNLATNCQLDYNMIRGQALKGSRANFVADVLVDIRALSALMARPGH